MNGVASEMGIINKINVSGIFVFAFDLIPSNPHNFFSDYPSYHRQQLPERVNTNENDYRQNFDDRDEIARNRLDDSEWNLNEYERNRDDRNLRQSLPIDDIRHDRRVLHELHGPLPPVTTEGWDQINNKHDGDVNNLRSELGQRNIGDYDDYDNLKARRHIRHGADSNIDTLRSVGDIHDSSQDNNNYFVDENNEYDESRQLRGSVKHHVDPSSKKSDVFRSDDNSGMVSADQSRDVGEKKILPVPLSREAVPIPPIPLSREAVPIPVDDSGFQGNHMQTEKEAFAEEAADAKGASSNGEGKVMVKGKVKQVKADIDQGPNPEKTYKRVEDFFQTQRESSIVEVPNAVKKEEASKLFKDNFIPVKQDRSDQVNKEQGKNSLFPSMINMQFLLTLSLHCQADR